MVVTCFFCKLSEVGCACSNYRTSAIADLNCFWHALMQMFVCVRDIGDVDVSLKVEKKRNAANDYRCYRCCH